MIVRTPASTNVGALNATAAVNVDDGDTIGINVTGTFAGTLTFQATLDNVNWVTMSAQPIGTTTPTTWVATSTTTGAWTREIRGVLQVRVQMTAYTSGTAVVNFVVARENK